MKSRFLWLTENMLFLRWCHGKQKDLKNSKDKLTFVEVANISNVTYVHGHQRHRFQLDLITDPNHGLIFEAESRETCNRFVSCIKRLALGKLDYQLLWDARDAGTKISVHWRAQDEWFKGSIKTFDDVRMQHIICFDDR